MPWLLELFSGVRTVRHCCSSIRSCRYWMSWGKTDLAPEAGVAVYVRGESGKLSAA